MEREKEISRKVRDSRVIYKTRKLRLNDRKCYFFFKIYFVYFVGEKKVKNDGLVK